MEDERTIVVGSNRLQRQARVLERRAIGMERASLRTQDDDRLGNGIGDSAKLLLVLLHLVLSALQVVDVGTGSIPSDDVAQLVAQRLHPDQEPSILAIVAP